MCLFEYVTHFLGIPVNIKSRSLLHNLASRKKKSKNHLKTQSQLMNRVSQMRKPTENLCIWGSCMLQRWQIPVVWIPSLSVFVSITVIFYWFMTFLFNLDCIIPDRENTNSTNQTSFRTNSPGKSLLALYFNGYTYSQTCSERKTNIKLKWKRRRERRSSRRKNRRGSQIKSWTPTILTAYGIRRLCGNTGNDQRNWKKEWRKMSPN